jgi:UDP-N-acetylmuramoyl-tripeptide--D-alanyl-D-alanine ligase
MAALVVVDRLTGIPVDAEVATRAFCHAGAFESGRLCPVLCGDGTVVIDDTYNANPASVRSSVATAREIARARSARLVLVIGEMRELGACSAREHAAIGQLIAQTEAAMLIGVSGDASHVVSAAGNAGQDAVFCPDAEAALGTALERVRPGDVVLVKASRGVRAERVVSGLCDARGATA